MFNIFKKKTSNPTATVTEQTTTFKIEGMHCTSCAMNIDGALEDLEGVKEASTNFAASKTEVVYDPSKVSEEELKQAIAETGYAAIRS